jgi:hypothetical protein
MEQDDTEAARAFQADIRALNHQIRSHVIYDIVMYANM